MAHTLEGGPVAKKRRKGGIRQRLSESMPALLAEEGNDDDSQQHQASSSSRAPPVAKMPSKLVQNLLKDFAWGGMSAQKAPGDLPVQCSGLESFTQGHG